MLRRRFWSGSMAGKVTFVGVCKTPPLAFSPGPPSGAFLRAASARRTHAAYCRRLLTDIRASRCSMNRRRLDSKAASACTASDLRAPAARSRAIRLSVPRRSFVPPKRDVGPVREDRLPRCYRAAWTTYIGTEKLGRLTLDVRAAARGSES
jgi:hypothetical protein